MNNRKKKKNLFSDRMWNDSPYYDFFSDEWFKIGYVDNNEVYNVRGRNHLTSNPVKGDDSITSWPERI